MGANPHVHRHPRLHLCLLSGPLWKEHGEITPFLSACTVGGLGLVEWKSFVGVGGGLRTLSLCLAHSLWAPLITHLGFSLLKEFLGKIKDPFHPQLLPE